MGHIWGAGGPRRSEGLEGKVSTKKTEGSTDKISRGRTAQGFEVKRTEGRCDYEKTKRKEMDRVCTGAHRAVEGWGQGGGKE